MSIGQRIAAIFRLDDEGWERHANPMSVATRFAPLPLLTVILWFRADLGPWTILAIALVALFTWVNPRLFRKPKTHGPWASRAVLGERLWLARHERPIPTHHRPLIVVTTTITGVGLLPLVYGLVRLEIWPTVFGLTLVLLGKTWFLDRMVWLYDEVTGMACRRSEPGHESRE